MNDKNALSTFELRSFWSPSAENNYVTQSQKEVLLEIGLENGENFRLRPLPN